MDRPIVYPQAIPTDADVLLAAQDTMIAIGYALQASFGQNSVVVGLNCTQTSPASMQVTVGPGAIITPSVIDATPYGSISADTVDPLIKMGINTNPTPFTLTSPVVSGQSQNYLIQVSFAEADDLPTTLTYYNSLNPSQSFSGPNNSGTPQNTRRAQRANLQLKVGTPANTGTQITPPVDAGWIGIWVITVSFGQTSVTASAISSVPNAPFLAPFLASHHGGVPGQAPKINLATEVSGVLSPVNLPPASASFLTFSGNPNGHVAGTAGTNSAPPTMCWDLVDDLWWTCVTTGSTSTAVWASSLNSKSIQAFTSGGTFVVPPGVTRIRGRVLGGGGGASGRSSGTAFGGAGGGGGGYSEGYFNVTPGASIAVTVGAGGAGGAAGASGTAGGTSSLGALCSATGGGFGIINGGGAGASGGIGGSGSGGSINVAGGDGGDGGTASLLMVGYGGAGAVLGSSHRGGSFPSAPSGNALAPGSGGSGSYLNGDTGGGSGFFGLVIVEW